MFGFDQSWHHHHWLVNSTRLKGLKVIFTVRVTAVINLFMDRILSARTAASKVNYLCVITRQGLVNNGNNWVSGSGDN